jgi:hypothetical protein
MINRRIDGCEQDSEQDYIGAIAGQETPMPARPFVVSHQLASHLVGVRDSGPIMRQLRSGLVLDCVCSRQEIEIIAWHARMLHHGHYN